MLCKHLCRGLHPVTPARWQITYYSCVDIANPGTQTGVLYCSGPRGIRTLDLFNAIEARSQLRHGPPQLTVQDSTIKQNSVNKMDLEGFEPSTSSVRLKRAPNCATGPS